MNTLIPYLVGIYHIPQTSTVIKQVAQHLQTYLNQQYMAPIPYLSIYRARKELHLMKSIKWRLKKGDCILRMTDKSGRFHLGHIQDYQRKAQAYREKTKAYIELSMNPLSTTFYKVVPLLNELRSKNHIKAGQLNQMMPKADKVTLAYLYFIPKPHKVSLTLIFMIQLIIIICFVTRIGRNTIATHCFLDEYTNNWYFQVFRSVTSSII